MMLNTDKSERNPVFGGTLPAGIMIINPCVLIGSTSDITLLIFQALKDISIMKHFRNKVGVVRFELTTTSTPYWYASQLRHTPLHYFQVQRKNTK